ASRYFEKRKPVRSALLVSESAAPSSGKILALIPESKGDSPTDRAITKARLLASHKPQNASSWIHLADAVMQKARDTADESLYDPAEMAYTRANLLDPRRVDALAGLAWVNGDRHLFEDSIVWANKALAIDPNNAASYGIRGDAELELDDYDGAFRDYQKMADLRPDLSSYSRGAHLLWMTGNRPKALALMEKALRAGSPFAENTAWCRAQLALMLFQDGAYLPADQTIAPALASAPRNMRVLLVAGRIKTALRDYSAAQALYRRVLEVAPNIEADAALGDLAAAAGQHAEAEKYYRQAEELHAVHVARKGHDHMQMARFDADHDRNLVDALRMAEQRKLTKNVIEADTLAWVYFKNGDLEKAREAISRALSHDTPDPEILFHAGMIAAKLGDRVVASKYLDTAVNWCPRFNLHQAPIAFETLRDLGGERSVATTNVPPEQ
ncbi:MAG: tetratricopeptide repeat protein, partial [Verrucomicrobiota bacterium]